MIDLERRFSIYEQWENFKNHKPVDTTIIHPYLLESWKRSKKNKIERQLRRAPKIGSAELLNRIHERKNMLEIAVPYMKKIIGFINDPDSIILITNENGIVLELFSESKMKNIEIAPAIGSQLLEKHIGTNGVGTALAEDRTLDIWAAEHYLSSYHYWYSSADTIHDRDGNIIGCLCLLCRWDLVNTHSLGMIAAVAGAIERQIHVDEALQEKNIAMRQQQAIVELINEGIIVIDGDERIRNINSHARLMFDLEPDTFIGRPIYEIILSGINFFQIMSAGQNIYDREATLTLKHKLFDCTMSTALIRSGGNINGMVITIKESKTLHRFISKISGSRAYLTFSDIIGTSEQLQKAIKLAKAAGRSNSNVLLLGESGTGKELFAQSIHNESDRSQTSFVAVNCGAIPRDLVESELFGYEGGAFTGSKKEGRPGKFELADGGTIFLDEIGDMPLEAQVNLLRVLQNSQVVRVGGTYPKKIDVRVIAATNKNLEKAIKEKSFREDLFYRLNVLSITIPPLRKRVEDIPSLANYFARKSGKKLNKTISEISTATMDLLCQYNWPGNIRELENIIERAVNIMETSSITPHELPSTVVPSIPLEKELPKTSLKRKEYELIVDTLSQMNGNMRQTALKLGIARSTLYEKIKKYNISLR